MEICVSLILYMLTKQENLGRKHFLPLLCVFYITLMLKSLVTQSLSLFESVPKTEMMSAIGWLHATVKNWAQFC